MSNLPGKCVFAARSAPDCSAQVAIDREAGTVTWPGGIDLCPDALYHYITGASLGGSPVGPGKESG